MRKFVSVLLVCVMIVSMTTGCCVMDMLGLSDVVALTIGEHELSTAELTYFYIDAINEYQSTVYEQYYSSFGNYWSLMLGFDTSKPLNEQQFDDTDKTWADYFVETAIDTAKDTYALYDNAMANGFRLSETEQSALDTYLGSLDLYASYYGYNNVAAYLRDSYGKGATEETYKQYYTVCTYASAYLTKYSEELEFDEAAIRAFESAEEGRFDEYSVVSYVYYTLKYTSYPDRQAMEEDMNTLLSYGIIDKETFDKAIQSLYFDHSDYDDNDFSSSSSATVQQLPTSTEVKRTYFANIPLQEDVVDWLKDANRKGGDFQAFEIKTYEKHDNVAHVHGDEDCTCKYTVDGYTLVLFTERDNQDYKMVNVRHILVKFQGGTTVNGATTYSDEEKAKAKEEAEKLLQTWKDGKANEESFSELANKESDDQAGKVTNGGLYEDIYKGQMVEAFEQWCFDAERKEGDTGLVETEYGWHVMYFSSFDEMTYRDALLEYDLRIECTQFWHEELVEKASYTIGDLSRMPYDYISNKT